MPVPRLPVVSVCVCVCVGFVSRSARSAYCGGKRSSGDNCHNWLFRLFQMKGKSCENTFSTFGSFCMEDGVSLLMIFIEPMNNLPSQQWIKRDSDRDNESELSSGRYFCVSYSRLSLAKSLLWTFLFLCGFLLIYCCFRPHYSCHKDFQFIFVLRQSEWDCRKSFGSIAFDLQRWRINFDANATSPQIVKTAARMTQAPNKIAITELH